MKKTDEKLTKDAVITTAESNETVTGTKCEENCSIYFKFPPEIDEGKFQNHINALTQKINKKISKDMRDPLKNAGSAIIDIITLDLQGLGDDVVQGIKRAKDAGLVARQQRYARTLTRKFCCNVLTEKDHAKIEKKLKGKELGLKVARMASDYLDKAMDEEIKDMRSKLLLAGFFNKITREQAYMYSETFMKGVHIFDIWTLEKYWDNLINGNLCVYKSDYVCIRRLVTNGIGTELILKEQGVDSDIKDKDVSYFHYNDIEQDILNIIFDSSKWTS